MTNEQKVEIESTLTRLIEMYNAKTTPKADRWGLAQYIAGIEKTLNVLGYEAKFNPFDGTYSIK